MSDTELLPKSKAEPVRRLEVFTGTGRRRTWTAEQKARIVAESYEAGDAVSAIARRHGLTAQQLFGWRREARCQAEAQSAESGSAFAPVVARELALHGPRPHPHDSRRKQCDLCSGCATCGRNVRTPRRLAAERFLLARRPHSAD